MIHKNRQLVFRCHDLLARAPFGTPKKNRGFLNLRSLSSQAKVCPKRWFNEYKQTACGSGVYLKVHLLSFEAWIFWGYLWPMIPSLHAGPPHKKTQLDPPLPGLKISSRKGHEVHKFLKPFGIKMASSLWISTREKKKLIVSHGFSLTKPFTSCWASKRTSELPFSPAACCFYPLREPDSGNPSSPCGEELGKDSKLAWHCSSESTALWKKLSDAREGLAHFFESAWVLRMSCVGLNLTHSASQENLSLTSHQYVTQ